MRWMTPTSRSATRPLPGRRGACLQCRRTRPRHLCSTLRRDLGRHRVDNRRRQLPVASSLDQHNCRWVFGAPCSADRQEALHSGLGSGDRRLATGAFSPRDPLFDRRNGDLPRRAGFPARRVPLSDRFPRPAFSSGSSGDVGQPGRAGAGGSLLAERRTTEPSLPSSPTSNSARLGFAACRCFDSRLRGTDSALGPGQGRPGVHGETPHELLSVCLPVRRAHADGRARVRRSGVRDRALHRPQSGRRQPLDPARIRLGGRSPAPHGQLPPSRGDPSLCRSPRL